jgi:uncharacterized protein YqjF (DUF2071 family)
VSSGIDRLSPARRPARAAIQRQDWWDLLFLHWEVPVSVVRPLVPSSLDVDTFEGRAFVGLIPFTMSGVRPAFIPPVPLLSRFHEVNVRTYVHRRGADPGVWFFSLDASSRLAVLGARTLFSLPYHFARMDLARQEDGTIRYRSERRWPGPHPARLALRYGPVGPAVPARPGTLEHFLIERYILYALAGTRLRRGQVHHEPYPVQPAQVDGLAEDLLAASGIPRPPESPLAHYARGVRVEIFGLQKPA